MLRPPLGKPQCASPAICRPVLKEVVEQLFVLFDLAQNSEAAVTEEPSDLLGRTASPQRLKSWSLRWPSSSSPALWQGLPPVDEAPAMTGRAMLSRNPKWTVRFLLLVDRCAARNQSDSSQPSNASLRAGQRCQLT